MLESPIMSEIDDAVAAAAFRRLVAHLRHRTDAENIDLMGLSGFCRNCLANWIRDASAERGIELSKEEARAAVYGMDYGEWKKRYQGEATKEQVQRMKESLEKNA